MKKILFLLLCTISMHAQFSTGQEAEFDYGIKNNAAQSVSSSSFITTTGADGTQGKILGENISISVVPPVTHFTPLSANIKGYLQGIDNAFGSISATTAGISTRIWFTADPTTITAGTFYLSNAAGKGTAASAIQTVANDDNQKKYFTQDIIGNPFAAITIFPPGIYAGNLSASTTPNSAQQRYTVELYRCNNAGTPIASGVTGAPVGDLGVTVVVILDSGQINLADGSVTNLPVAGVLPAQFSIAVGERIRYHVSAEKVGTVGNIINQSVYYGTSYNSYLDVPVTFSTNDIRNASTVLGATATNALDNINVLKANLASPTFTGSVNVPTPTTATNAVTKAYVDGLIPTTYAKVVYVNNVNPNSATIFDLNNPPTVNDNALKVDVNNLYIGSDASTWVYNGATYVTKTITYMTTDTPQTVSGLKTFFSGTLGFRNIANTFTSFFSNTNTASRTYTFPDVSGTLALDINTMLLSGNQTFSGTKSSTVSATNSQAIDILLTSGTGNSRGILISNSNSGFGAQFNNSSTGNSIMLNNTTAATGDPLRYTKNLVLVTSMNNAGELTAPKHITTGGLATQVVLGTGNLSTKGSLTGYTVATLPVAVVGDCAYVTDALTPTYLVTVAGGGAVITPVFYNGTNWVAH